MENYLLGQQGWIYEQSTRTKHLFFLCYLNSRAKSQHWVKDAWPASNILKPENKNIIIQFLVKPKKITLPFLCIKIGLMKQFVKALDFYGHCSNYVCYTFPGLSKEKIKAEIFSGPQIR